MHYDFIFIGGGCASFQMVHALLKAERTANATILILEANKEIPVKSWCMWVEENHAYSPIVEKIWPKLKFKAFGKTIEQEIAPYSYQYISAKGFYDYHHQFFEQHANVQIIYQPAIDFTKTGDVFTVNTPENSYTTNSLLDSRIDFKEFSQPLVIQHFLGWMIETEEDLFDTETATFMDFDVDCDGDTGFVYTLPFSSKKALVELTFFNTKTLAPEIYREQLKRYWAKNYPNKAYKILSEEQGKIPMSADKMESMHPNGAWKLGTTAGITKASTGYTFKRIMDDTQSIISILNKQQTPPKYRGSATKYRFYDEVLIQLLIRKPAFLKKIMFILFSKHPFQKILRFLDEKTNLTTELGILASLPTLTFMHQLWLNAWRKKG